MLAVMIPMRQSRRWRAFAILMLIAVIPYEFAGLFRHPSLYDAARYGVDTIAVIGLVGYAYGRPLGPYRFWRLFGPLFLLFTIGIILAGLPTLSAKMATQRMSPGLWTAFLPMLALLLAMPAFMTVALLRHGGWLRVPGYPPRENLAATFA